MKAYKITLLDKETGKRFYGHCSNSCIATNLGWFHNGQPIIVPASMDDWLAIYWPSYHEEWRDFVTSKSTVWAGGVCNDWIDVGHSIAGWNGRTVYGLLERLVGCSIYMWDDMRMTVPGFDTAIRRLLKRDECDMEAVTGLEMKVRYIASFSWTGGPMSTPMSVDIEKMQEWLYSISQFYASMSMYCIALPGHSWDDRPNAIGTFVHYLGSTCQTALSDIGESVGGDNLEDGDIPRAAIGRLVVDVEEIEVEEVPVGRPYEEVDFSGLRRGIPGVEDLMRMLRDRLGGDGFVVKRVTVDDADDRVIFDDDSSEEEDYDDLDSLLDELSDDD